MTTDAEHKEMIVQLMKDERRMDWSVWPAFIYDSHFLTPAGKDAVLWARDALQRTLGDNFIREIEKRSIQHSIFSHELWPAFDGPIIYANLFQLAAQIEILQSKDGWSLVRDALRRDLRIEQWASSLLQLEVAGLGLKAGWQIELERLLPTDKRTDVVLIKESTKLLVETKVMVLSGEEQEANAYFYRMVGILLDLAWKYGVRITGSLGSSLAADVQTRWLNEIKAAAIDTAKDGKKWIVPSPVDGQLEITKDATKPGISPLENAMVETDVGRRLFFLLRDKNEQYEGAGPAWVCLGDYGGLWQSSSLQGKSLSEKLDILTPYLQARLAFFPNLAGVILSPGKGAAGNHPIEPLNTPIERNGGIAMRCIMPERNQIREGIIVTQVGKFTEQARIFADLYQQESSWLDWALKKLEKPPFDELVHLSE